MSGPRSEFPQRADALVSIVLPLYNEAKVLRHLHHEIVRSLVDVACRYELIFVNDGSTDESRAVLGQLANEDARVRVVHLSRNFGHQAAVQAGLADAAGDAVVVMDSDLQDDPGCLREFLEKWQRGYDVIYAVRANRKENALKKLLFYGFYRVLNLVSDTPMPNDAGNFGLIDRRVVDALLRMPESDRYYSGLRTWVGFRQIGVTVERGARHDGRPRVTLPGLVRLAKTAIFSFSSAPLAMFYAIAALSLAVCVSFTAFTLYHKWITGLAIPGWTSMIVIASFFGAINALGIGVLGEYVVRIYDQVRQRPQFVVADRENFSSDSHDSQEASMLEDVRGMNVPDFSRADDRARRRQSTITEHS